MRQGQRGFIYPHGFVRDRVNFGSKPERHDGGGGHRIDHASTIYQDLMMESAIFVKVEKMEVRRGSSSPCA